jgi:hypothetical protein
MLLFFGLYWFFLRKEKLLVFNRYFLIISILVSLTVPFISFSINLGTGNTTSDLFGLLNIQQKLNPPVQNFVAPPVQKSIQKITIAARDETQSAVPSVANKRSPINWTSRLMIIYLSGFVVMLIRFFRNILFVFRISGRSQMIDHEWYKIALLERPVNPFSFLRTVYVNKQDYLENRIAENVLRHELEHVRQSHSVDIIFFEIFHIVLWFNPILFLYKWAARINHEYLADEAVIRSFSDMKSYANELINFISHRVNVPFTSGFSPSMIRLRLLMLNTNTTRKGRNIRILLTSVTMVFVMSVLTISPAYPGTQDHKNKKGSDKYNEDIVTEDVLFRDADFKPLKALFILDGKILGNQDTLNINLNQIKTINILKGRKAIRKYGRDAKNGAVAISTYEIDKKSQPDTLQFKPICTVNDTVPKGKIAIAVSNLKSLSVWTYPLFRYQDLEKRWRTIGIMTRDYYQIKGKVIQKNGEPLAGALLSVPDNPSGVVSDKDGHFLMKDIKPHALAEISAAGYEHMFFTVVFTSDLTITLDKKGETDDNNLSIYNKIIDFSGTWKLKESEGMHHSEKFPDLSFVYVIHQFGSDSIKIKIKGTSSKENYEHNRSFVFNTVKKEPLIRGENIKAATSCSIFPDGKSFSTTTVVKSTLGIFQEQTQTDTYSLSDNEKQMIIRRQYSLGDSTFSDLNEIYNKI